MVRQVGLGLDEGPPRRDERGGPGGYIVGGVVSWQDVDVDVRGVHVERARVRVRTRARARVRARGRARERARARERVSECERARERAGRGTCEPMQGRPSGELVEGPYDDTRPADAAARRPLLEALVQAARYTCRHQW